MSPNRRLEIPGLREFPALRSKFNSELHTIKMRRSTKTCLECESEVAALVQKYKRAVQQARKP